MSFSYNKELELPVVWQFTQINQTISLPYWDYENIILPLQPVVKFEYLGATPFQPVDIVLTKTGTYSYSITGEYGMDISTENIFTIVKDNVITTYNRYLDLIKAQRDNLIKFYPDPDKFKIFYYYFRVNDTYTIAYSQLVRQDQSWWIPYLQTLLLDDKHELGTYDETTTFYDTSAINDNINDINEDTYYDISSFPTEE